MSIDTHKLRRIGQIIAGVVCLLVGIPAIYLIVTGKAPSDGLDEAIQIVIDGLEMIFEGGAIAVIS